MNATCTLKMLCRLGPAKCQIHSKNVGPFQAALNCFCTQQTKRDPHLTAADAAPSSSLNDKESSPSGGSDGTDKRYISLLVPHSMGGVVNTHQMVKVLKSQGFNVMQSEAITEMITSLMLASAESQFKHRVSKEQLEISVQQLLAQIDGVKKDMLILEKSQFTHLRHDLDTLTVKLTDECAKLKGGFALDMNLEKSRAKEDNHKLQTDVQALTNRIGLEVANMRADIANLRANFEGSRTDTIKYVARTATGTIVSVCTIGFIIYRFMQ